MLQEPPLAHHDYFPGIALAVRAIVCIQNRQPLKANSIEELNHQSSQQKTGAQELATHQKHEGYC
jgi:hypothetical protein